MVTSMRSSDVILGLSYDVPAFTIFQELLAKQLSRELGMEIDVGTYTHLSASLHIYERHFKMVEKILDEDKKQDYQNILEMPNMPNMPPVKQLMMVEGKIRNSSSIVSLSKVLDELATHHDIKDDYWIDWCKVLASHRAAKLNDQIVANKLLSSTIFEGYRYFSKA